MYRYSDKLPKVGIRPTIDGRRNGVRESLEEKTMKMAISLKNLIESTLRHPSGERVECVISDTTIGGFTEALECSQKFRDQNVGLSITVTPCWCYGSETIDMTPDIPKAIWGFNGTERPGAVYLAAALAAHSQFGIPAFGIYGSDVQDMDDDSIPEDVKEKLIKFTKSGLAVATMKGKSYLSIGGVSMGIAGSIVDNDFLREYLGLRTEFKDMSELIRRIDNKIYDQEEYEKALKWVKENCKEGIDINLEKRSPEIKEKEWEIVIKMTLIMRDMMIGNKKLAEMGYIEESVGNNAIVSGFQGQRQWTDFMPNGDFTEAILNSSFDWNGIREAFVMATENDILNGISMLFGHLITGTAQIFADVRTYWSAEAVERVSGKKLTGIAKGGIIHLINSGSATLDATGDQIKNGERVMKPYWEITEDEMKNSLNATKWSAANYQYFRGGGFSSNFLTKGQMPVTMSRINMVRGLGPVLQIVEGYAVNLDEDIHRILNERTDPTWPTTWFVPKLTGSGAFTDVYSVMNNWGANHGAISYGHIGDDLITLASMLRIPVNMHNVEKERIFRPKVWSNFGTENLENADYLACKNFGPLYK